MFDMDPGEKAPGVEAGEEEAQSSDPGTGEGSESPKCMRCEENEAVVECRTCSPDLAGARCIEHGPRVMVFVH